MILLALTTGMRVGDLVGLRWENIELDSGRTHLKRGKGKKAGIKKRVHFHLLRYTYLTRLYSQTKDLRLVQEVAGHADISTTQIYTHISGEDVRQAMLETAVQK